MPEDTENWRDGLRAQVVDEIDGIIRAFRGSSDRRPDVKAARNDHGVDHLYAEGQILVRADYLERVLDILGQPAERDLLADPAEVCAEADQDLGGDALTLADQAQQQVLRANVFVGETFGLFRCVGKHPLAFVGQR